MRTNRSIKEGKSEIIIELLNKGYSYGKIQKETGCSKSSIAYHGGPGQKGKNLERLKKQNGGFKRKVWWFIHGRRKPEKLFVYKLSEIRKKGRDFFYGDQRRDLGKNMLVKKPKVWVYWGKIFPDITSKEESVQAVNQWTGKPEYYDDGKPMLFPYCRCKLTDEIVNVKGNDIHVDHADGCRNNNNLENFTLVKDWSNQMKGNAKSYDIMEKRLEIMLNTRKKYKI